MIRLKIAVTKEILLRSCDCGTQRKSDVSQNCAIAEAVRDIFPKAMIGCEAIYPTGYVEDWSNRLTIKLPPEAISFIKKFDKLGAVARVKMEPFEFEIEVPDKVVDLIDIDELKELLLQHPCLKLAA